MIWKWKERVASSDTLCRGIGRRSRSPAWRTRSASHSGSPLERTTCCALSGRDDQAVPLSAGRPAYQKICTARRLILYRHVPKRFKVKQKKKFDQYGNLSMSVGCGAVCPSGAKPCRSCGSRQNSAVAHTYPGRFCGLGVRFTFVPRDLAPLSSSSLAAFQRVPADASTRAALRHG